MIGIGIRIPQTGKAPFSPASLGTPLAWLKGDDATWDGSAELGAGVYSALTNQGSLGGTFASASNAAPIAVAVGTRNVPAFRGTRRAASSVSVASWPFLHNATGTATLTVRFYLYDTGGSYRVFATSAGGAAPGVRLLVTGSKAVAIWSNASADSLTLTSTANVAAGWNTVTVTKNAADCAMSLNGETALTGSIGTPSASNPSHVPCLGNVTAGASASALNGIIAELVIHGTVLDSSGLSLMRSYMSGQWSATPTFSPISLPTNLIGDWNLSKGVTLNGSNISALADQGGLNNDMVQATSGNQPLLVTDWRNGHEAHLPNDRGDFIQSSLTSGALGTNWTVYCIGEWAPTTTTDWIVNAAAATLVIRETGTRASLFAGTDATFGTATPTTSTPYIFRARFAGAGASEGRLEQHGVTTQSGTGLSPGANSAGAFFGLGSNSGASAFHKIARAIVYDGTPTGAQEEALMAYLRSTYNVVAA